MQRMVEIGCARTRFTAKIQMTKFYYVFRKIIVLAQSKRRECDSFKSISSLVRIFFFTSLSSTCKPLKRTHGKRKQQKIAEHWNETYIKALCSQVELDASKFIFMIINPLISFIFMCMIRHKNTNSNRWKWFCQTKSFAMSKNENLNLSQEHER